MRKPGKQVLGAMTSWPGFQ